MKNLEEIRAMFEHKKYDVRSDFIDEYDFNDKYLEYYRNFIIDNVEVVDNLYLSDLIDLAGWLNIYDIQLRERWFSFLFKKKHYIVKLSVLDYFKFCPKKLLPPLYEFELNNLLKDRTLAIIRNQIYFNLICLNSKKNETYIKGLKKSLDRTNDWRSIYRTLKNIKELKVKKSYKLALCDYIKVLVSKNDFGDGVEQLLQEVCDALHN